MAAPDDDRDSYVKSEIEPLLDPETGVPAVYRARKLGQKTTDTIKYKQFRDSVLHLLGGKVARVFRRITVAVAILDEWSAFDWIIEKRGDPGGLAKGRLEGAPFPKFIGGSTPGTKGLCHVDRACEDSQGYVELHITCPRCDVDHPLSWGGKKVAHGFKWEPGRPETVRHVCPHCHESISQSDYLPGGWPLSGTWVCSKTGLRYGPDGVWRNAQDQPCRPPRTLGLHIWAAYSPQRTWVSIVDEFIKAHRALKAGDAGPMTTFTNETLAQTWELAGERTDEHALQLRAEPYPLGMVPEGALVLTAGVDVQGNRWEITVWGWGRGLESWVIEHKIIYGNPANEDDWQPVTEYLHRRYPQAVVPSGSLGLSAISIDSSDQTQAVYNWVRTHQHHLPQLRAIKGLSEDHKPILCQATSQEVSWRGKTWPNGVKLWGIGVDTAKDLLLGQLAIERHGPGFVHTSEQLPREWYEQLTAEQRVLVKSQGRELYRWVRRRPRNEVLDCRNYAMHAAMALGLHKYTDARWCQLEAAVQPKPDLFSLPPVPQVVPVVQATSAERARVAAAPRRINHDDGGWSFDRRD